MSTFGCLDACQTPSRVRSKRGRFTGKFNEVDCHWTRLVLLVGRSAISIDMCGPYTAAQSEQAMSILLKMRPTPSEDRESSSGDSVSFREFQSRIRIPACFGPFECLPFLVWRADKLGG